MGVVHIAEKPPLGEKNRRRRMRRENRRVSSYRIREKSYRRRITASGRHVVENNPLNRTDPTGMADGLSCHPGAGGTSVCTNTPLGSHIPTTTKVSTSSNGTVTTSGAGAMPGGRIAASTDGTSSWTLSRGGGQAQGATAANSQNDPNTHDVKNRQQDSVDGNGTAANNDTQKTSNGSSPFAVTDQERALPMKGDLRDYWYQRYLQGDPMAPIGLAMWGNASDKVMVGPYWDAMGAVAMTELRMGIGASGQQVTPKLLHNIGIGLAKANNAAIDADIRDRLGAVPGLLDPSQITALHRDVFGKFGISNSYFGGTPIFGQAWETQVTSWLWCQTCDTNHAPGGG